MPVRSGGFHPNTWEALLRGNASNIGHVWLCVRVHRPASRGRQPLRDGRHRASVYARVDVQAPSHVRSVYGKVLKHDFGKAGEEEQLDTGTRRVNAMRDGCLRRCREELFVPAKASFQELPRARHSAPLTHFFGF